MNQSLKAMDKVEASTHMCLTGRGRPSWSGGRLILMPGSASWGCSVSKAVADLCRTGLLGSSSAIVGRFT